MKVLNINTIKKGKVITIPSFTENLGNFLTECRNTALKKLEVHPAYADWRKKQISLNFKIETELGAEFLDEYMDAMTAIHSMEVNTALIFGAYVL